MSVMTSLGMTSTGHIPVNNRHLTATEWYMGWHRHVHGRVQDMPGHVPSHVPVHICTRLVPDSTRPVPDWPDRDQTGQTETDRDWPDRDRQRLARQRQTETDRDRKRQTETDRDWPDSSLVYPDSPRLCLGSYTRTGQT